MSKAPSLGKTKCQNWLFSPSSLGYCTQPHETKKELRFLRKTGRLYSCKNITEWKNYLKYLTRQHTYIHTHQSGHHPCNPDRGLVGLLSVYRQRQNGCQATQPGNLLGSLELADIWPAWLTMVHKGDHNHNPLWPLLSCCNRYQTELTHFATSSHLCLAQTLTENVKMEKTKAMDHVIILALGHSQNCQKLIV